MTRRGRMKYSHFPLSPLITPGAPEELKLSVIIGSSMTRRQSIRYFVILRSDGVCPAAIKGRKNRFGDVGILGVVAKNNTDPLMQLMSVSPLYVEKMADKIANMLFCAVG